MKNEVEVWYDCETTGLKIEEGAAVVQFACIIVYEGEVVDQLNININPLSYPREVTINKAAMEINGYREEDFASFTSMKEAVGLIKNCVYKWNAKYKTKARLIGYNNSTFDKYFIEDMFNLAGIKFDMFFKWKQIDIFELVKALQFMGIMGETFNQKLGTIAEYFKLETEGLHDAYKDIHTTRDIYLKIKRGLYEDN